MAQFKSKIVTVNRPASYLADKFSDLSVFGNAVNNLPDAERERIGEVTFEKDAIKMNTKQVGAIEFRVVDRSPNKIEFQAVGSPVPLSLVVNLMPADPDHTDIETLIEVDIPPMLRPFIGGAMQKAADQFGELMAKLDA